MPRLIVNGESRRSWRREAIRPTLSPECRWTCTSVASMLRCRELVAEVGLYVDARAKGELANVWMTARSRGKADSRRVAAIVPAGHEADGRGEVLADFARIDTRVPQRVRVLIAPPKARFPPAVAVAA